MNSFDDRLKGFEAKYSHDQNVQFRVHSRRDKLIGLWAAEQFGLEGDAATEYAKSVVLSDFEEPGDDDVIRKLVADFASHGQPMDEAALRGRLDHFHHEAKKQIADEIG